MTRAWWVVGALLVGGVAAMGCGSSASAGPSTSAAQPTIAVPTTFTGTNLTWLSTEARPWNKRLNLAQAAVIRATRSTAETDASLFFSRLAAACSRLEVGAVQAGELPAPPSVSLESEWRAMTIRTRDYAASCLALARSRSNAAFKRWDETAKAMDSANAALNADVAKIRAATPSGGT